MRLQKLLDGIAVQGFQGEAEIDITGLAYDSRAVKPGYLFVALRGHTDDGHDFIEDAVKNGAAAVIAEAGRDEKGIDSRAARVWVSDSRDAYLDQDLMSAVDLIVPMWTMGKISSGQEKALLKAVRNGAGLAGWHGGMCDSFRQNVDYQFMTGGQWVAHPGGVIDYSVQVTDHDDPVTAGLKDFDMHSEQYYMHVDPNMKVLATTTFSDEHANWIDGCTMPVTWKKMYGKGRVFYSSLGHVMKDFEVPEALEIMKRGIKWASGSKYEPAESWKNPVY